MRRANVNAVGGFRMMVELQSLIAHKGLLIGLFLGVFKVMQSMRSGNVKVIFLVTDIIGSTLMGYGAWEMGLEADLARPVLIAVTIIMSLNAFIIIPLATNPMVLRAFVKAFTKVDIGPKRDDK